LEKLTIEVIIQLLKDFYKTDKDLALVLIGLFGGWILSHVFPTLRYYASKSVSFMGRKFGGRLAHKSIRESYLNWLIYKTQDLNLTGLIGSGDKPKLEQIFISLSITAEQEKSYKKFEDENEILKKSFFKRIFTQYLDTVYSLRFLIPPFNIVFKKFKSYYQKRDRASKENMIFISHPYCNFHNITSREGVSSTIVAVFFICLFIIFPLYSLIWSSNINTVSAFFSSILWSLLIITGLVVTSLWIKEQNGLVKDFGEIKDILFLSCFFIIPAIMFVKIIQEKVILESQSPLAIGSGIVFVIQYLRHICCGHNIVFVI